MLDGIAILNATKLTADRAQAAGADRAPRRSGPRPRRRRQER